MSRNTAYAEKLNSRLRRLPSILGVAVSKAAYSAVLNNTTQDSGEAAFNWRAQINTSTMHPYQHSKGRAPVGISGEKRSQSFDRNIVIDHRYTDLLDRLRGKEIKFVHIYNPIEDEHHAINAQLDSARAIADNSEWLNSVAEVALNAHLR